MTPTDLRNLIREHTANRPSDTANAIARDVADAIPLDERDDLLVELLAASVSRVVGAQKRPQAVTAAPSYAAPPPAPMAPLRPAQAVAAPATTISVAPRAAQTPSWKQQSIRDYRDELARTWVLDFTPEGGEIRKALADFTARDCERMAGITRAQSTALRNDAETFRKLYMAMGAAGVATVGDLGEARAKSILGAAA